MKGDMWLPYQIVQIICSKETSFYSFLFCFERNGIIALQKKRLSCVIISSDNAQGTFDCWKSLWIIVILYALMHNVDSIISISSIDLRLQSDLFKHTSHGGRCGNMYEIQIRNLLKKKYFFFQQGAVFSN